MKIKEFLRENQISLGDNVLLLLEKLGLREEKLIKRLESEIGETAKMSKSKGNVVDPEDAVERYGADTVRLYILFAAPPQQDFEWTDEGIQGAYRFLNRLWNFITEREEKLRGVEFSLEELRGVEGKGRELRRLTHQTVKDYLVDMEEKYQFNTAIAKIMKLFNEIVSFEPQNEQEWKVLKEAVEVLLILLSPITPHLCEELWHRLGKEDLIVNQRIPEVDESALIVEEVEIPVQINGKLRGRIRIPFGADENKVREIALSDERIRNYIDGKEIRRVIYVRNKLINIVVS